MSNADQLARIRMGKYISVETFRKNGAGVKTPVWFALAADETIYVYTEDNSGKVKRIRNNPRVRVAPCDIRGNITGESMDGTARLLQEGEPEYKYANALLNQKYWLKRLFDLASFLRFHKRAGIAIRLV
jgi:PPOX class probable F420-dependent enzyme